MKTYLKIKIVAAVLIAIAFLGLGIANLVTNIVKDDQHILFTGSAIIFSSFAGISHNSVIKLHNLIANGEKVVKPKKLSKKQLIEKLNNLDNDRKKVKPTEPIKTQIG